MKIVRALEAPAVETPHKVSSVRSLHSTEHVQMSLITLEPGEALRPHITPVDATFYVLEGVATVEIGDEREEAEAHCLIHSPAKIVHRVLNQGDERVRFLVIKTPRQTDASQIL